MEVEFHSDFETIIDVPIGGTLDAVRKLEVRLGIDLTGSDGLMSQGPKL